MTWALFCASMVLEMAWLTGLEHVRNDGSKATTEGFVLLLLFSSGFCLAASHSFGEPDLLEVLWIGVALLAVFLDNDVPSLHRLAAISVVVFELLASTRP